MVKHQNKTLTVEHLATLFELLAILEKAIEPIPLSEIKSDNMKIKKAFLFLVVLVALQVTGQETFTLTSKNLTGQALKLHEFNGFGCVGDNISPQLAWSNAPEGTKSFAVTMYDPDAPTGSGWWHWLVFDIPGNVFELVSNAGDVALNLAPLGAIQSITDYGSNGYGGPCPPEGDGLHQYIITVYALGVSTLGLDANTNPAVVGYYLNNNVLGKASLVAYYQR